MMLRPSLRFSSRKREEKRQLRQRIGYILEGISKEEWGRRSKNVEKKIRRLPEYKKARTIVVYWPLAKEVDLRQFIRKAKEEGKTIGLPVLRRRGEIEIFEFTTEEELVPGKLGIMQPDVRLSRRISLEEIDLVVVPGIAFDKKGNRLGRGRGWYDELIKLLPARAEIIGVALAPQVVDNLPIEPYQDEKVRRVITA